MSVPCVRVRPNEGEATRQALAGAALIDEDYEITVANGWLYVPVRDPDAVPQEYDVVEFDADRRETQTLPRDILGYDPSLERLGRIAILDEAAPERANEIADAVVASSLPVDTVVNRASKVHGEYRLRNWEVLAHEAPNKNATEEPQAPGAGPATETVHTEYGVDFLVDIAEVYFSPRLATERHRVVQQVAATEQVFDMFAGVGPFVVPMAKRGAECVGCDLNPRAIEYLRENARRNGVEERVTALEGDVRDWAGDYEGWADRIVMNLPHSADEFLETALTLAGDECVLHFYDISHEDDPFGPGTDAVRAAAGDAYDVTIATERIVRSYAPHEVNICLDIHLARRG